MHKRSTSRLHAGPASIHHLTTSAHEHFVNLDSTLLQGLFTRVSLPHTWATKGQEVPMRSTKNILAVDTWNRSAVYQYRPIHIVLGAHDRHRLHGIDLWRLESAITGSSGLEHVHDDDKSTPARHTVNSQHQVSLLCLLIAVFHQSCHISVKFSNILIIMKNIGTGRGVASL